MNFYRNVFLIITILLFGCSKDPEIGLIYLDTNGVTIKCDDTGMVGDTFTVKGITYTIVDEDMLRELTRELMSPKRTSKITDMSECYCGIPNSIRISVPGLALKCYQHVPYVRRVMVQSGYQ